MTAKYSPFVIGVLADLSGQPVERLPPLKKRRFVTVTRETLPQFFRYVRPTVQVGRPGDVSPVVISFDSLEQLSLDGAIRKATDENELQAIATQLQNDQIFNELCAAWQALEFLVLIAAQFPDTRYQSPQHF